VLKQIGYQHVQWYGKWHVGGTPQDYGFEGWQPPDAGNYLSLNDTLGGGEPDNDGRFLTEVCNFFRNHHSSEPFCVVASFVNPHDVYVAQHKPALGYTPNDFNRIHVPLPSNLDEDPDANNKPRAQGQMSIRYVPFENSPQDYVNFYAYLHQLVDAQIGALLDALDDLNYTDTTLILRTADHGEQALSHSLVEKFYNCYQESIHIPLVVSNPILFPERKTTQTLSSHLDILPTLTSLVLRAKNAEQEPFLMTFQGKDLTPILDEPDNGTSGRHRESNSGVASQHVHFTYDDIPCPGAPSVIRCIRTKQYKYAVYFDPDGSDADWELYDVAADPLENTNLAGNPMYASVQQVLDAELVSTMKQHGTLPKAFQWPPLTTHDSRGRTNTSD
jgi:arylsulfatase A-like enzyme